MLKKTICYYIKLLDEKLESGTIVVLIIAILIILVSIIINDFKINNKKIENNLNSWIIELNGKNYKLIKE